MVRDEDRDGNIIKQMREERKERKGSTRGSERRPDHLPIYSIIRGLDIKEGNDWIGTMVKEVSMHEFMEAKSLIKSTSRGTETTLSEIKRRRETGKKRSKGELEKLPENRGKRNRAVVGRERWVTLLKIGTTWAERQRGGT